MNQAIKERAESYAISISPYSQENGATYDTDVKKGYYQGAIDQKQIDIDTFCDYCENNWEQFFKTRYDMKCFKGYLCKMLKN